MNQMFFLHFLEVGWVFLYSPPPLPPVLIIIPKQFKRVFWKEKNRFTTQTKTREYCPLKSPLAGVQRLHSCPHALSGEVPMNQSVHCVEYGRLISIKSSKWGFSTFGNQLGAAGPHQIWHVENGRGCSKLTEGALRKYERAALYLEFIACSMNWSRARGFVASVCKDCQTLHASQSFCLPATLLSLSAFSYCSCLFST